MSNMITCRGCGKEIHKTTHRCPACGASQLTGRYKNKAIAGVLGIFLGGLGIHRFYLGQWWGLFYLLFWITGIPSLVSIIEGIVFLASNQQSWDDKFNNGVQIPEGSSTGIVIAIVVGAMFFMVIPVMGILAAIAIPAYQDYIVRAKVAGVLSDGAAAKVYVEEYAVKNNSWPKPGEVVSLPALPADPSEPARAGTDAVMSDNGAVVLTIRDKSQVIDGKTIVLEPDASGEYFAWSCKGGTLENRYRPPECRQ